MNQPDHKYVVQTKSGRSPWKFRATFATQAVAELAVRRYERMGFYARIKPTTGEKGG